MFNNNFYLRTHKAAALICMLFAISSCSSLSSLKFWDSGEVDLDEPKPLESISSSKVIKIGTKAVIRHLKDAKDHQLDCRVDGVGEMMVTAQFVKK